MSFDLDALGVSAHYEPLIGGKFTSVDDRSIPAANPATGERLATYTRSGAAEIDLAVKAAQQAAPDWAATPLDQRSRLLHKLADWVEENTVRLAHIDTLDVGRTISETPMDHAFAARQYRFFAGALLTHDGWHAAVPGGHTIVKREPLGVVGQIIPWNVPSMNLAFKLAPALAAGNAVVLKPDENAALSVMEFAKAAAEILPPGVVNIVPGNGDEAGAALTAHPGIAKIAFTGSSAVGRLIAHAGAERLVPVSLELGGKSPNIVFPDVEDLDRVVDNAAFAVGLCNGQACLAGTRLLVHDEIYDAFVTRLTSAFGRISVGDPQHATTQVSCLVSERQGRRVLDYIESGKREANLLAGGSRVAVENNDHGYFVQPTVFESDNRARVDREEIFGPVVSVIRWKDVDDVVAKANDSAYGLAAGVYTGSLATALTMADRLQAGSVWVNQYFNLLDGLPFGGFKESGYGREGSKVTLDLYTQLKSITLMTSTPPAFYAG